ncbi:MAG: anthranilate phosphoribosyltransferase [Verrucomicrobiota bacterium]
MKELTAHVKEGNALERDQVGEAVVALLSEEVAVEEKAVFLRTLSEKGETPDEVSMFVESFLERSVDPGITPQTVDRPLIDVCGTGGDRLNLFNVSTTSVFVLAAGGMGVVKHGNRGITSKSGGADVLEALGISINLAPKDTVRCLEEAGACFLFAQKYHPAFKAVAPVRQVLAKEGCRTIFNVVGPLLNPARPEYQMVGVFKHDMTRPFAEIMSRLGRRRAWAVHGTAPGGKVMDEFSTLGRSFVSETDDGSIEHGVLDPESLGFETSAIAKLKGGSAAKNAELLEGILSGEVEGPMQDMVVLNAGAAFVVGGLAKNVREGIALSRGLIGEGMALASLRRMQEVSRECSK